MRVKCWITGCELYVPVESKGVHGDLYMIDGIDSTRAFVFVACVREDGQTAWEIKDGPTEKLVVACTGAYLDRRGVITFVEGMVNRDAKIYIQGM